MFRIIHSFMSNIYVRRGEPVKNVTGKNRIKGELT